MSLQERTAVIAGVSKAISCDSADTGLLRRGLLAMTAVLFATLSATGIVFAQSPPPAPVNPNKVLTYDAGAEPQSLDPALYNTVDCEWHAEHLFEGLVTIDTKTDKILPGVAQRWTISPDGKVYTFYLRKNARWSDGSPVTINDFIYSRRRTMDPKTGAPNIIRFAFIKNFIAKDLTTFEITLKNPFPPFLAQLTTGTFSPVKKEVVEKYGDLWTRPEHMVSNGAFMLKEWRANDRMTFLKNPYYWDAKNVTLDQINAFLIEDLDTALKKYQAGEIDFMPDLPQAQLPQLLKQPDIHVTPSFGLYYYVLNVKNPTLSNVKVRQALALSIDRKVLVEKVMRTGESPATGLVGTDLAGYPYAPLVSYDPEKAKQLFAEAGYPNGQGFPTLTLIYNLRDLHKLIAETIQQMWKKNLGINIELRNQDWKVHIIALQNHNFEIARLGGIPEYMDPAAVLQDELTGNPNNYAQWSNAEFDQLWAASLKESNPKKRFAIFSAMEKLAIQEMPNIPIYFYVDQYLIKPYVQGIYQNPEKIFSLKHVVLKR